MHFFHLKGLICILHVWGKRIPQYINIQFVSFLSVSSVQLVLLIATSPPSPTAVRGWQCTNDRRTFNNTESCAGCIYPQYILARDRKLFSKYAFITLILALKIQN